MRRVYRVLIIYLVFAPVFARAEETFRYPEGRHGKGELRYIHDIPVLVVEGSNAEIGEQIGVLALKPANRIVGLVSNYAKRSMPASLKPVVETVCRAFYAKFPEEYQQELDAMAKAAGVDQNQLILANTIIDLQEMIGCSSLIVAPQRSETGGPLYGRNLDAPLVDGLADYSLLIVYRPREGFSFALPNLPGFLMFGSGMNSQGLALGSQSVKAPSDGSGRFDPTGISSAVAGRRLMEQCKNVGESQKWLEINRLVRCVSIAACDPNSHAVFEVTTKRALTRGERDEICCATNHFRHPELAGKLTCPRYSRLIGDGSKQTSLGIKEVAGLMDSVKQGKSTIHAMIFEPASLRIHLTLHPEIISPNHLAVLDLVEVLSAVQGLDAGGRTNIEMGWEIEIATQ